MRQSPDIMHPQDSGLLAQRLRFEELLTSLSAEFIRVSAGDLDEAIRRALSEVGPFLGAERALVFHFEDDYSFLGCSHEWAADGVPSSRERLECLALDDFPWIMQRYRQGQTVVIPRVADLPAEAAAERDVLLAAGVQSMLAAPLVVAERVWGVVCLDWLKTERNWPQELIKRMRLLGDMFANALERKRVELELQASEARARSLVDMSPICIIEIGVNGRILALNPAGERTLNPESGDRAVDRLLERFAVSEQQDELRRCLAKAYQGNAVEIAFRVERGERSVELAGSLIPIFDSHHLVCKVLGVFNDVTERKLAEDALRESENRFQQLADHIQEVVWLIDWATREVLYISPAFESIWGLSCARLYQDGSSWRKRVHQDDRARVAAAFDQHAEAGCYDVQFRIFRPDGDERWIHDRAYPIRNEHGEVLAGVSADITRRMETEQALNESNARFRAVMEQAADALFLYDFYGNLLDVNRAACESLGYDREELVKKTVFDIEQSFSYDDLVGSWDQVRHGAVLTLEGTHQKKSGETIPVEVRVAVVASTSSAPYVVALARDISQRKQAEAELRQRDAELARLSRVSTMGQVAAELAHEINQPLYAISNFAEACNTIAQSLPEEKAALLLKWTRKIEEQAKRAGGIVRRVHRFVSKGDPKLSTLDINNIVRDVAELLEFDARARNVEVRLELGSRLPLIRAERIAVEQVLVNLMQNGFDAMRDAFEGERRLTITSFVTPDGQLGVAVRDTGEGFGDLQPEGLMAPFFTPKPDGIGMGLAICRSTVESNNGRLYAESNPAGGVTFTFTWPGIEAGIEQLEALGASKSEAPAVGASSKSER